MNPAVQSELVDGVLLNTDERLICASNETSPIEEIVNCGHTSTESSEEIGKGHKR